MDVLKFWSNKHWARHWMIELRLSKINGTLEGKSTQGFWSAENPNQN